MAPRLPADAVHDLDDVIVVLPAHVGELQLAPTFDPGHMREHVAVLVEACAVDHDLGDRIVVEQVGDRPVMQEIVHDSLRELPDLLALNGSEVSHAAEIVDHSADQLFNGVVIGIAWQKRDSLRKLVLNGCSQLRRERLLMCFLDALHQRRLLAVLVARGLLLLVGVGLGMEFKAHAVVCLRRTDAIGFLGGDLDGHGRIGL